MSGTSRKIKYCIILPERQNQLPWKVINYRLFSLSCLAKERCYSNMINSKLLYLSTHTPTLSGHIKFISVSLNHVTTQGFRIFKTFFSLLSLVNLDKIAVFKSTGNVFISNHDQALCQVHFKTACYFQVRPPVWTYSPQKIWPVLSTYTKYAEVLSKNRSEVSEYLWIRTTCA